MLIDHLAELAGKLRRSSGQQSYDGPLPVAFPPLQVAAKLLTELGRRSDESRFTGLGTVLAELLESWQAAPGTYVPELEVALERLNDWLGEVFASLDAGQSVAALADHRHWLLLLESFRDAGTPLAVISDMEDLLRAWEGIWCDRTLTKDLESDLQQRWFELRAFGDTLLAGTAGRPVSPTDPVSESIPSITGAVDLLLLVDSDFRRDQLQRILAAGGYRVASGNNTADLGSWTDRLPGTGIVLCDNLEPSNNLLAVQTTLAGSGLQAALRLILVVGHSGGTRGDEQERAIRLGAHGVWVEPFLLTDLRALL